MTLVGLAPLQQEALMHRGHTTQLSKTEESGNHCHLCNSVPSKYTHTLPDAHQAAAT